MSIKERLRLVLDANCLKIKEISDITGIPYRTFQNYLLSDRNIKIDALAKLYTYLGININWLLTGEGEMQRPPVEEANCPEWLGNGGKTLEKKKGFG